MEGDTTREGACIHTNLFRFEEAGTTQPQKGIRFRHWASKRRDYGTPVFAYQREATQSPDKKSVYKVLCCARFFKRRPDIADACDLICRGIFDQECRHPDSTSRGGVVLAAGKANVGSPIEINVERASYLR